VILKEEFHKPVILTLHENHEWFLDLTKEENPCYVKAWKDADQILRVNEEDIIHIQKFNTNVEYMPNGFNSHKYFMDKTVVRGKNSIFALGVLTERKGYQDLILSVAALRKEIPDIKCYIAGQDGGYENDLKSLITSMGLENNVIMMGSIPSEIARQMMNSCSIFCHPSVSESFGVVQIEAMACGAPVVATYNGASEKIIEKDCGMVVERGALSNALLMALTVKNWDHEYICETVKKYDMDRIAERLCIKYANFFNNNRSQ
jgi:teichuronic acid biosynthesis glycosyltransferase TuaC